ncbi:type 2 isopentenyl-diphosphate Delta-isomerase [Nocardia brasiliensis]
MIGNRKDDHVRLAAAQQQSPTRTNDFDHVRFVHHALGAVDRSDVVLRTDFAGETWQAPLYVNAMTGGSVATGRINRDLAIAARETGLAMATGSLSAYLKDPATADTYRVVRQENPKGFLMANVNATVSVDDARRAVDLLEADALQIHLNTVQEIVMPEGDREFAYWAARIEQVVRGVDVPVIVKEVGCGLSRETVALLRDLGVYAADVAGRGGTDFASIENSRRTAGEYGFFAGWGQSAPACLLDAAAVGVPLLASGGVRHPLDIARSLALGAVGVGVSGRFLGVLVERGADGLIEEIRLWLDQLTALMTVLGAGTPAQLTQCALLISGELREFCAVRGLPVGHLANRYPSAARHPRRA